MTDTTPATQAESKHYATKPLTGAEYIESIRDAREVYIYGERVKDVTTHPAFSTPVRSVARLYDALHDTDGPMVTVPTDTGSGGITHPFYKVPHSIEDLVASRDAIAEWARMTYGWMGRTPDYKAAFLGTLGVNDAFYAPYDENARRWYRESQERSCTGTTRSSTRRSTATCRRTRWATCSCTWSARPTTAWSSRAPRWSRPGRR